jgi:hypothetical protein
MIASDCLLAASFSWGVFLLERFLFERGAGKVASGVFNEVSLALVGVSLPGLIPILVYF